MWGFINQLHGLVLCMLRVILFLFTSKYHVHWQPLFRDRPLPQNYLRVALQEVDSGCTAKTLQVHPYSTTEEVCSLCAYKFKVPDPENHALFLVTKETSQQLAPDTHPQRIKAEVHSRPHVQTFHFVYRRVPNLNLCIPASQNNGNCL